ncbi:BnaAnng07830D [Brassica napus]|uniref:BnaAnng07830D protein n=1 Tax=Brassica napus TaxID=3708 RepID=A0A078I710_BRANA|nr:BnaAnng07830D [Brassica napus]
MWFPFHERDKYFGPELVAKYQFYCRSPFTIDDKAYLEEGVTEEQHRQAIRGSVLIIHKLYILVANVIGALTVFNFKFLQDLVGGHPIVCSKHMLEIMFNEPQLLIVFRVALEIEMVYSFPDEQGVTEDPADFPSLTIDDIIDMEQGYTLSPVEPSNYEPGDEVLYGEPVSLEEMENAERNFAGTIILHQPTPLEVEPVNIWRGNTQEEPYWDGMMEEEDNYEVYVTQSPHPSQGVEPLPLAPNRRVNAPQPATIIMIDDEDDGSYTGSSEGVNENDNISNPPPPEEIGVIANEQTKSAPASRKGESSGEVDQNKTAPSNEVVVALPAAPIPSNEELSLDLTLGVGKNMSTSRGVTLVDVDDSVSEGEEGSGGFDPLF